MQSTYEAVVGSVGPLDPGVGGQHEERAPGHASSVNPNGWLEQFFLTG